MYEIECSMQDQVCCIKSKCVAELQLECKAALLFKVWVHVFEVW